VSFGRHYKASTRTFNFVAMATPTPGAANSVPLVGPVVISEIMYHPPVADAEYLELANITTNAVTLFDVATGTPWKMTEGLTHEFPVAPPLTLAAGEKILLVRNSTIFGQNYSPPTGTRVFQWTSGGLDNGGETIEISKPGDTNNAGIRQYIRVDRVDYADTTPWPTGPDGSGTALARINERAYGNDVANWAEAMATPGQTSFQQWVLDQNFPVGQDGPDNDPDFDGLRNALEYALGSDPQIASSADWNLILINGSVHVAYTTSVIRPDVGYYIQKATNADLSDWANLNVTTTTGAGQTFIFSAQDSTLNAAGFYRLAIVLFNH
jgi:hypothetical protein